MGDARHVCSNSSSMLYTYLVDLAHCNVSVHNPLAVSIVIYQEAKVPIHQYTKYGGIFQLLIPAECSHCGFAQVNTLALTVCLGEACWKEWTG